MATGPYKSPTLVGIARLPRANRINIKHLLMMCAVDGQGCYSIPTATGLLTNAKGKPAAARDGRDAKFCATIDIHKLVKSHNIWAMQVRSVRRQS